MNYNIVIPSNIKKSLIDHLFQNDLEQAAFLFANIIQNSDELILNVFDSYLVPKTGWEYQSSICLEMRDTERSKIMKMALQKDAAVVDCHSHPTFEDLQFSLSDIKGITDFAAYAKWKLNNKPFAAIVWGKNDIDAVIWDEDFNKAREVNKIIIDENKKKILHPLGSWFYKPIYRRKKGVRKIF